MLSSLSITRQFTLLGILGVLLTLAALGLGLKTSYDLAFQAREAQLQSLTEGAVSTVEGFVTLANEGVMTEAQAQQAAKTAIGSARFDHGNYFFIYSYDGIAVVYPDKSFIGTNRYYNRDPYGTLTNGPLIDAARAGHPIFHQYFGFKAGQTLRQPKLTYAAAVPEWGWVIGTGLYVDDLKTALIDRLVGLAEIFVPLFLVFLVLIFFLRRSVAGLVSGLTVSMERIAEGVFNLDILGLARSDDMGRMARRVAQFRDDAVEKRALEARAEADRVAADAERAAREAEREAAAREQNSVVDAIATGLTKLSAGELVYRITKSFSSDYERLRNDFNSAMQTMQETIQVIVGSAQGLRSGAGEITQASDDLSRRTEQQAATLEQTAAALDEITATVRKTAEGASNARDVVETAKTDAERSGDVVRATVEAMSGIEESSRQISNIISVIDEIAFQTNLLALNAGVEAARAGDSGRGFAVVATEVRALAQRSADAAKEIKGLISASGAQVDNGVKLVAETGQALTRIVAQVSQLNHLVTDIAASAMEQSTGLHEVNIAMHQMDQVTQQNAAMVEETTAAAYNLSRETTQLTGLVSRFQTNAGQVREPTQQRLLVEA